jgi:hypothetical protein
VSLKPPRASAIPSDTILKRQGQAAGGEDTIVSIKLIAEAASIS